MEYDNTKYLEYESYFKMKSYDRKKYILPMSKNNDKS